MKYIPLSSLQNQYPSVRNYKITAPDNVRLNGVYEGNFLDFKLSDIKDIGIIPNSTFRHIIAICDNPQNDNIIELMTSDSFFNELEKAKNDGNPYFLNSALNPKTFVYIYIDPLNRVFEEQRNLEKKIGVKVDINILYDSEGVPNFEKFGKFIDWILTKGALDDVDTNGVIPVKKLTNYFVGAYDQERKIWGSAAEIRFGLTLDDLNDELKVISDTLKEYSDFINNPDPSRIRPDGQIAALIGVAAISVIRGVGATAIQTIITGYATSVVTTSFGLQVTIVTGLKTAAQRVATGFLGGPVGIALAVASVVATILVGRKKKKEQEEAIKKTAEYIEKLRTESERLVKREQEILTEIKELEEKQKELFDGTITSTTPS
jgi:hypothetical protein